MLEVDLKGDWKKLGLMARALPLVTNKSNKIAMMQIGLRTEKKLVGHIEKQDLGWKDLDDETKKHKRKEGKSDKTLVSSSQYFQSITSYADSTMAFAGVKRGEKYREGEEIADIAKIHEYGSEIREIPARPLYRPTSEEMKKEIKSDNPVPKAFLTELKKRMGI